jgi:hypothetical protein
MKRRKFIRNSSLVGIVLSLLGMYACKETKKTDPENTNSIEASAQMAEPFFKLSLAQWSIHKMIKDEGVDPYTFAEKAKNWGFTGLEYVSQLYPSDLKNGEYSEEAMAAFVEKSNAEAKKHGMRNVLIMIDGQGSLGVSDAKERDEAVERHYK